MKRHLEAVTESAGEIVSVSTAVVVGTPHVLGPSLGMGAFGHILEQDEPRLVEVIARALRPGGRFIFVTAHPPSALNPGYWLAKGFNAAMRVRNALWKPPFVMYYLTFLMPRARELLEAQGFEVDVRDGRMPPPFTPLSIIVATWPVSR